jgi:hypothetical protein
MAYATFPASENTDSHSNASLKGGCTLRLPIWVTGLLMLASMGCASSQSAASASPSVDVTGTWVGTYARGSLTGPFTLRLQQSGARVVGEANFPEASYLSGPVEGRVTGNELSYRALNGRSGGELMVNGNEMSGYSTATGNRFQLQRQQ